MNPFQRGKKPTNNLQAITMESQPSHGSQNPSDAHQDWKVESRGDAVASGQNFVKQQHEEYGKNEGGEEEEEEEEEDEEEKTSSRLIALEQEWLYTCERADFYRRERNYFRSVAYQQSGFDAFHPRPPSPQMRHQAGHPLGPFSQRSGSLRYHSASFETDYRKA
jgi:hypothetical protein